MKVFTQRRQVYISSIGSNSVYCFKGDRTERDKNMYRISLREKGSFG
jgi:hypothetical protein